MSKNITSVEAIKELARRHRDASGAKLRGHKLRETDARYNLPRQEILDLRTPELVRLAAHTPAVSTPKGGRGNWHTDRMNHPAYAATLRQSDFAWK